MQPASILLSLSLLLSTWCSAQCPDATLILTASQGEEPTVLDSLLRLSTDCSLADTLLGDAYHRLGILYYLTADFPAAITATQSAVSYREKTRQQGGFLLGKSNHNLGVFYKSMQDYTQAIPHFRSAADIYDELQHERAVASRRELANAYSELHDYGLAQLHINLALEKARQFGFEDVLAQTYLDYGKILYYQRSYGAARDTLNQAVAILQQLPAEVRPDYWYDEAACYLNLGLAHDELGQYDLSQQYSQKAYDLGERLADTDMLFRSLNNMGVTLKKQERFAKAETTFQKSLDLFAANTKHYLRAYALDNLGNLATLRGAPEEAILLYQQAIRVLAPALEDGADNELPTEEEISASLHKSELVVCLIDQAAAFRSLAATKSPANNLKAALVRYQLADRVLDAMRLEHQSSSARYFWRQEAHRLYEEALDLCYQEQEIALAFYFMEKSKSVLLLDYLMASKTNALLPATLAERERELQLNIYQENSRLEANLRQQEISAGTIAPLRKALATAQANYQDFIRELSKSHPTYYQRRYADQVISVEQARALFLSPKKHLLHYFDGRKNVYLLCLDGDQGRLVRVTNDQELKTLLQSFSNSLRQSSAITDDPQLFADQAHAVYQKLYAPGWEATRQSPQEVIIIPDGIIGTIPFAALLTEPANGILPGQFPYLLRQQQVGYAYSATVLAHQSAEKGRASTTNPLLFLAPFTEPGGTQPALPAGKDLYQWLRSRVKGQFLQGEAATVAALRQSSGQAGIIHLSTHADGGDSLRAPSCWLADSRLFLSDLYHSAPDARLVVLSACETGTGQYQPGEGTLNLASGFAYAGAESLLFTRWKVNDRATGGIMQNFYQSLLEGRPAAASLRAAQLAWLDDTSLRTAQKSPHYWSSFVYWGTDQQDLLITRTPFPRRLLLLFLGLAGIGGMLWLWWRRR